MPRIERLRVHMVLGLNLTGSRSAWDGMTPLDGDGHEGKVRDPLGRLPDRTEPVSRDE